MKNPWLDLKANETVLESDRLAIEVFNKRIESSANKMSDKSNGASKKKDFSVATTFLPEPFFGPLKEAPIVVLLSNPGMSPMEDTVWHTSAGEKTREFQKRLRLSLTQENSDVVHRHFHLDYPEKTPGRTWWRERTRELVEFVESSKSMSGHEATRFLAERLLAIEFFPYHSLDYDHSSLRLKSQEFSFDLVRQAIKRNAVIVLARGKAEWFGAVPELDDYECLTCTKSRAPHLTRKNLDNFEMVLGKLRK